MQVLRIVQIWNQGISVDQWQLVFSKPDPHQRIGAGSFVWMKEHMTMGWNIMIECGWVKWLMKWDDTCRWWCVRRRRRVSYTTIHMMTNAHYDEWWWVRWLWNDMTCAGWWCVRRRRRVPYTTTCTLTDENECKCQTCQNILTLKKA